MLRGYLLALTVLLLLTPTQVIAQADPFALDPEVFEQDGTSDNLAEVYSIQTKSNQQRTGSGALAENLPAKSSAYGTAPAVERLINSSIVNPRVSPDGRWTEFRQADWQAQEKYGTLKEWRMQEELDKPLPPKEKFRYSLDDVDEHIKGIKLLKSDKDKPYFLRDSFGK